MKFSAEEFYPTPAPLLEKMTEGIDWTRLETVLEPSAGKGDIVDFVKAKADARYNQMIDIDCIEIDPDLRSVLRGKGHRVIYDDFLSFRTQKRYDLIIMNPPFSKGASHLMKALEIQERGGGVLCVLNAETLKNPYTNERKALLQKLNALQADIRFLPGEFVDAERPTGVEVAVVKVLIPEEETTSILFSSMKKKIYGEKEIGDITALAPADFIDALVTMYDIEVAAGLNLIREYKALRPYLMSSLKKTMYDVPTIEMSVASNGNLSENDFVKEVRRKYWTGLFADSRFTGKMTSNMQNNYMAQIDELVNYDFSLFNICWVQKEMSQNVIEGIEDCIIQLFDKLSFQYSYSDELSSNIHYYNGWKTNKSWIINKKVILPYMNAYSSCFGTYDPVDYHIIEKLSDIEKALNFLDGGLTDSVDMKNALAKAKEDKQTKKIRLKYFQVTFYKKGTCHIEFLDEDLLKKLNIFGSQHKKWLPPGYGNKTYEEMSQEERSVIDEFEGKKKYEETLQRKEFFLVNNQTGIKMLAE